jgi:hypothetical protein
LQHHPAPHQGSERIPNAGHDDEPLTTPKWLAPLALLLDLYDKVALSTQAEDAQDLHSTMAMVRHHLAQMDQLFATAKQAN